MILLWNPYTFKVSILRPSLHQRNDKKRIQQTQYKLYQLPLPNKPHLVIQSNVVISTLPIKTGKLYMSWKSLHKRVLVNSKLKS